ncbi:hypothetical protein VNO77_06624 [Canavalia gladiata]|uniref:Uncharacterized protein n=1 Tax=Canavalia gladiata TaxID=3824 RepID=A0AAN9M7L7_CANGL
MTDYGVFWGDHNSFFRLLVLTISGSVYKQLQPVVRVDRGLKPENNSLAARVMRLRDSQSTQMLKPLDWALLWKVPGQTHLINRNLHDQFAQIAVMRNCRDFHPLSGTVVKANVNIQTYGNTINIRPTGLHTEESKLVSLIDSLPWMKGLSIQYRLTILIPTVLWYTSINFLLLTCRILQEPEPHSRQFDLKMCQPSQGVLVLGHDLLFLSRPSEVYVNSHELRSDRLEVCLFDPGAYFELQELAG